jgi:LysR family glycine cleavage system transcriptional activator
MTDRVLVHDALARGELIVPFGKALKTVGVYAL